MKNAMCVLGLTVITGTIGWSFGSGHMDNMAALTLILAWMGVTWSCMQD